MSRYIFASLGVRNEIIRKKLRGKLDTSKRVLIIPCAASNEDLTAKVEKEALCKSGFEKSKVYTFDTTKPNMHSGIFFDYIYVPGAISISCYRKSESMKLLRRSFCHVLKKGQHILVYPQVLMLQPKICVIAFC